MHRLLWIVPFLMALINILFFPNIANIASFLACLVIGCIGIAIAT